MKEHYESFLKQGLILPDEIDQVQKTRTLPRDFPDRVLQKYGPAGFVTSAEGVRVTDIIAAHNSGKMLTPRTFQNEPMPTGFQNKVVLYQPVSLYDAVEGRVFLGAHNTTFILDRQTYLVGLNSPDSRWITPAFASAPVGKHLRGTAAILFASGANLYSHWMFDLLPKFEILKRAGWSLEDIDHFVVNSFNQPFQRETFQRMGIPEEKVVVANGVTVSADRLLIASPVRAGLCTPQWNMQFIRTLFDCEATDSRHDLKLYISRFHARRRRIENETDIRSILESSGFQTVFAEHISVAEIAKLIARCSHIVATHGAGVMNVVFAPSDVQMLEIYGAHISLEGWFMTEGRYGRHYLLPGKDQAGRYPWQAGTYEGYSKLQRKQANFWVDTSDLKTALNGMRPGAGCS